MTSSNRTSRLEMPTQTESSDPAIRSEIEFGLNLLRQQNLSKPLVFSPFSISLCVSLLHAASTGKTRDEIREALLRSSTDEKFEEYFSSLLKAVSDVPSGIDVNIANHVFCLKDYPIKKPYLDTVRKLYNAGATALDFSDKVKSAEVMNKFVAEATKGHITNIITPEQFEKDLVAVFTNALYFKADWSAKFEAPHTRKRDFFMSTESKRSIDFMHQGLGMKLYSENDQFEMLRMAYRGTCTSYEESSFAMNIFLPKTRCGLKDAIFTLTAASLQDLLTNTNREYCTVRIPKWKIETNINLNDALRATGIKLAFDIDNEEFRQLAENKHGVSEIAHSAMIEMDEEGTTASACTRIRLLGGGHPPPKIIDFVADHPFLFVLTKDLHPIFMGIYC
ncbi:hypothetical protein CAEBREN_03313 [Caenorhabditis brenneri]|uniref:Serpin domain-containing protein n=1 Tax=Caenorhabditis brenneri TaxID=135651 RepID=G0MA36_CAEBE|nr:hypothetical protein CAEBREN_03313 [Caenorhabditis brenneri]